MAAKRKSVLDASLSPSEAAADLANEQYREIRKAKPDEAYTVLPGGRRAAISQFIDHDYIPGEHSSIFADATKFMKEVKPGCKYVWAAKHDPGTFAKVRAQMYRPVQKDEIRDDTATPIETHKMAGKEYVGVYDVILMEVPERAVKQLYQWPEAQAVMKTAQGTAFQNLKGRLEGETGGKVTAESSFSID